MTKLFQEIMPDNLSEFLLLGGVSGMSYALIKHYAHKLAEARQSSEETIAAMKKTEEGLNQKIKEIKERHQEELAQNTISSKAKTFLRSIG